MASHRQTLGTLLEDVAALLGDEDIETWAELESDSTVVRVTLASGLSVIVKRVTDTGLDLPGHEGAPQRFLNEWAGLEFLADIGSDVPPSVVAVDRESCILVLEDLGDLDDLESILLGDTPEIAERSLIDLGMALGHLHGLSREHRNRFLAIQARLGTGSPMSDTTMDQRLRRVLFTACFESAGVELGDRLWRSICEVEELIHDHRSFRAFVHADAGPHNVLLDARARLIDFEFGVYRSGLADAAGTRLGFPQTAAGMAVPTWAAERMEKSYRETLVGYAPEASDDDEFVRALAAACAHWALNRLASAWRLHIEPRMGAGAVLAEEEAERLGRTMLMVDGFVALAGEVGVFEELAETVNEVGRRWRSIWPRIPCVATYPSLAE